MLVRLKSKDEFIEVDSEFPLDEMDTFEKREEDLDDTVEIPVIGDDNDEK